MATQVSACQASLLILSLWGCEDRQSALMAFLIPSALTAGVVRAAGLPPHGELKSARHTCVP